MNVTVITFLILVLFFALAAVAVTWAYAVFSRLLTKKSTLEKRSEALERVLAAFINKLGSEKNINDALNIIAPQICEDIGAESVAIFIRNHDHTKLHGACCTETFPVFTDRQHAADIHTFTGHRERSAFLKSEIVERNTDTILGEAFLSQKPKLINIEKIKLARQPLPKNVHSMMILPLIAAERFVGLIAAVNRTKHLPPFNEDDLERFSELSGLVAMTANLITAYDERARQERIQNELNFLVRLQKTLLPAIPKKVGPFNLAAQSKPCFEVSGDFYDFIRLSETKILLMIADARGKGLPAYMMSSNCKSFVRALASHYTDLRSFVENLNRLVNENSDAGDFVTANILVLDTQTRQCDIANAGHTDLFFTHPDGTLEAINPEGMSLGMWPDGDFQTQQISLANGGKLCLFTDGLNEALDRNGNEYGRERLEHAWQSIAAQPLSPGEAIRALFNHTGAFTGDEPQSDDQTLFVITATP